MLIDYDQMEMKMHKNLAAMRMWEGNTVGLSRFLVALFLIVAELFPISAQAQAQVEASEQTQTLEKQLFQAVGMRDQSKAIALIKAGADVNATSPPSQKTILYYTTEKGLLSVVKALVRKGAKVNPEIEGYRGIPLTIALALGHEDIAHFLIDHGGNTNYVDSAGYTMLSVAVGRVSNAMLGLLIDRGCDVNALRQPPLLAAIRRQAWDNARFLIEKGADIHYESPLQVAARYGGFDLVKLLVAKGADVRARNAYSGRTALHEAALYGDKAIVAFLIDQGADVNASGVPRSPTYGEIVAPPILNAAYRGHFDVVKLLVAHGADINFCDGQGGTPFSMAVAGGHLKIVEWLAERGAQINSFDKDGEISAYQMPLLNAVSRRNMEMIRLLVARGARIDARSKEGKTALGIAQLTEQVVIADFLVAHGATALSAPSPKPSQTLEEQLLEAIYFQFQEQDKTLALIEAGANVNTRVKGEPLLQWVAGNLELVKRLVAKGADVRAKDPVLGQTALHRAASIGRLAVAEFLIAQGADVNASGSLGKPLSGIVNTPIIAAARRGHFEMVKLLAAHGADLNFRGQNGMTALSAVAALVNNWKMIEWLVEHGAKIDSSDKDYELDAIDMPLLTMLAKGDVEQIRFLLDKGARVNAKSKDGQTALRTAKRLGRQDIVDLLIARGATE